MQKNRLKVGLFCTRYYFVCGVVTLSLPIIAHSNQVDENTIPEVKFGSTFFDGANGVDLTRFNKGNPIIPGEYNVDIFVNGEWKSKSLITFTGKGEDGVTTCFTASKLLSFNVAEEALKNQNSDVSSSKDCLEIGQWIDDAFYKFDLSNLRLDISIPQVAFRKDTDGINSSSWDRGINGGFLSYNGSVSHAENKNYSDQTDAYLSVNAGLNLAGWQLRHYGNWSYRDFMDSTSSKYQSGSTYIRRAFPEIQGVLTLGETSSSGSIFDSFGYIGLNLTSDASMLPEKLTGYAPRIRGFANTNAKVEIRQQDKIIYQTTVAAGNFEIDDLYSTGYRGNLDVSIIENDGTIQTFVVPYSSVIEMLRPGQSRYDITLGEFKENAVDDKPFVFQGQYRKGLNNLLTGYTGLQYSKDYLALSVGAAIATRIGSVSLDVTHSHAQFENEGSSSGQSYRLSYNKAFIPTNTNITLAAYRYSTEDYFTLRNALVRNQYLKDGYDGSFNVTERSQFQISLNQQLPKNLGNLYMMGSWSDYWKSNESTKNFQIGYNTSIKSMSIGLSATKRFVENTLTHNRHDDVEYQLSMSVPLNFGKTRISMSSYIARNSSSIGVSGYNNDRLSYSATTSKTSGQSTSFSSNASYKTNYTTVGGNYSQNSTSKTVGLNIAGSVVGHAGGVHFGADRGETIVIIHAPDASGAAVSNIPGLYLNKSGYAVMPYATAYRSNTITLDPSRMSRNVELEGNTQIIVPYSGSISKVSFATRSGKAIYIKGQMSDGEVLPFAATVLNAQNENIGMVGQGGLIYLRSNEDVGTLKIKWGQEEGEQCQLHYDITASESFHNMFSTEEVCQ